MAGTTTVESLDIDNPSIAKCNAAVPLEAVTGGKPDEVLNIYFPSSFRSLQSFLISIPLLQSETALTASRADKAETREKSVDPLFNKFKQRLIQPISIRFILFTCAWTYCKNNKQGVLAELQRMMLFTFNQEKRV